MFEERIAAGVGRALIFKNNELIGVAKTLTDTTFDFTITAEEVRGLTVQRVRRQITSKIHRQLFHILLKRLW